jgi:hypothetical protein
VIQFVDLRLDFFAPMLVLLARHVVHVEVQILESLQPPLEPGVAVRDVSWCRSLVAIHSSLDELVRKGHLTHKVNDLLLNLLLHDGGLCACAHLPVGRAAQSR